MKKILSIVITMFIMTVLIVGCSSNNKTSTQIKTHIITDSIGRQVELPYPVTKAVVANAYNTELINAVNAIDSVVGVDYNIFKDPTGFKGKFKENQVIGKSQREPNYEKIIELNPQVFILTGNGAWQEAEKKLKPFGIKVVVCDAYYTESFFENCKLIGDIFGKEKEALELSSYFSSKLDYVKEKLKSVPKKTVYFEYRRIGNTTVPGNYFYKMVEFSGGDNVFKNAKTVEVDPEAIIRANPEYIVKVSNINVQSTYEPPTIEEHKAIKNEIMKRPGWSAIDAVKKDNILLLSHYVHGGASKIVGSMYIAKYLYPKELKDLHPEMVFKDWLEKYQHLPYIAGHTYPAYNMEN